MADIKPIGHGAFLMAGAIKAKAAPLVHDIERISHLSPFRKMATRRATMSAEMTNCGQVGWLSDARGYRYTQIDPLTGKNWPQMTDWVASLATQAASQVGFNGFQPNVCLINKYIPGTRLRSHIDKDEGDITNPIVSFSFGLSAVFRWGGLRATDPTVDLLIKHGDILIWGGADRLRYHAIAKIHDDGLETGMHERLVMTFRHTKIWKLR